LSLMLRPNFPSLQCFAYEVCIYMFRSYKWLRVFWGLTILFVVISASWLCVWPRYGNINWRIHHIFRTKWWRW
jgi:hypothetical protein